MSRRYLVANPPAVGVPSGATSVIGSHSTSTDVEGAQTDPAIPPPRVTEGGSRLQATEVLSTEAVRTNPWLGACPLAAGVWRQRDDALCPPQHWGIHHYALELEDAAFTARRFEHVSRPGDLLFAWRIAGADDGDLGGMDGDLGIEANRHGVVGLGPQPVEILDVEVYRVECHPAVGLGRQQTLGAHVLGEVAVTAVGPPVG